MAFVAGALAKAVGDEPANSPVCQRLLCSASLLFTEMLWVSRQHLHCTCSIHGTLSQHEEGQGGGGTKVEADESVSKSRVINSESRQVLVGDEWRVPLHAQGGRNVPDILSDHPLAQ